MKLGAIHTPDPRDLKVRSYFDAEQLARVDLPSSWGYDARDGFPKNEWGFLGNDQWGDCVFAGAAHETMIWLRAAGRDVEFSDEAVLSDYGAVTGFDAEAGPPGENPTDQGTDVHQALKYRVNTGIVDASGERHKLGAFLAIDLSDSRTALRELLVASYLFEAVALCWNLPTSALDQYDTNRMWSYVDGSPIDGGHYTCMNAKRRHTETVTWGRSVAFGARFREHYLSAAYALLSPEALEGSGRTPQGLDLATLKADLADLAEL